jgi:hypothetical protein
VQVPSGPVWPEGCTNRVTLSWTKLASAQAEFSNREPKGWSPGSEVGQAAHPQQQRVAVLTKSLHRPEGSAAYTVTKDGFRGVRRIKAPVATASH